MNMLRPASFLLLASMLLPLAPDAAAQARATGQTASVATGGKAASKVAPPIATESLSGLDLIPNRKTGMFGIRINHRLTQPATPRLIDVKTGRFLANELLQPSSATTRAVQVGRLAFGEYKMEVVLPDTVYWKTVRVGR